MSFSRTCLLACLPLLLSGCFSVHERIESDAAGLVTHSYTLSYPPSIASELAAAFSLPADSRAEALCAAHEAPDLDDLGGSIPIEVQAASDALGYRLASSARGLDASVSCTWASLPFSPLEIPVDHALLLFDDIDGSAPGRVTVDHVGAALRALADLELSLPGESFFDLSSCASVPVPEYCGPEEVALAAAAAGGDPEASAALQLLSEEYSALASDLAGSMVPFVLAQIHWTLLLGGHAEPV